MEREKELTSQESLELITSMINKAKNDYKDTGVSALLWGSIITLCSVVTFFNYYWQLQYLNFIWFLTILAVIPQILISKSEKKARKHTRHQDDLTGGIWMSYAIAIFLISFIQGIRDIPNINSMFLTLYGIPTFASGYGRRFKPMIIGGIACWVFAVLSLYTSWPYQILYNAAAAQLAWFIPGLILRRGYLKAKQQHV
jgi:hypothetical protein